MARPWARPRFRIFGCQPGSIFETIGVQRPARATTGRAGSTNQDSSPQVRHGEAHGPTPGGRSEEHTSELQSLMRISYAVFCLKKKNRRRRHYKTHHII